MRNLFVQSKSGKPTSIEATVLRINIVKITMPDISGDDLYYSVDLKTDNNNMYSILLPSSFSACPVEVGQRVTIVLDEILYIVSKGFKFYDYTHYMKLSHKKHLFFTS